MAKKKPKKQSKAAKRREDSRKALKQMMQKEDMRTAVYGATYLGLTYTIYQDPTWNILEKFLFQWQELGIGGFAARVIDTVDDVTDFINDLGKGPTGLAQGIGWFTGDKIGEMIFSDSKGLPSRIAEETTKAALNAMNIPVGDTAREKQERRERDAQIIQDGIDQGLYEGEVLEHKLAQISKLLGDNEKEDIERFRKEFRSRIRVARLMFAMGLAGALMMFLQETSVSEVADIAVSALDAVTPGT